MRRTSKLGMLASGGIALALSGCDPTVRDTVLGGVEGASTTLIQSFIQAFFETLQAEDEGDATVVLQVDRFADDAIFA